MYVDVVDLREFYASPLGRVASRSMTVALSSIWSGMPGERFVGLGYCVPWLDRFRSDTERTLALMPASQGAVEWPVGEASATAIVHDDQLPLPDSCVDRLLMVHLLEHAESPAETLKEAWRVLAPGGRLLIAVPNRRGLWARFEHTPFGFGRPYSRSQLSLLLREALLTPVAWSDALHFPPTRRRSVLRFYASLDRFGRGIWPIFPGVILVEATKRLYQGLPATARAGRRSIIPVLVPQGSSRTSRRTID
ncbi:MAG: methyltransferase domain-containing protein [Rhizobiaceae bacterium]